MALGWCRVVVFWGVFWGRGKTVVGTERTVSSQKRSRSALRCCLERVISQRPPRRFRSSSHMGSIPSCTQRKAKSCKTILYMAAFQQDDLRCGFIFDSPRCIKLQINNSAYVFIHLLAAVGFPQNLYFQNIVIINAGASHQSLHFKTTLWCVNQRSLR